MIIGKEKESIRRRLLATGACAVGFALADSVEPEENERFREWIERGDNAGMVYMTNYPELREDPRGLLDGAKTVISLAFSYKPEKYRPDELGIIASYAYGKDYHKELRRLLKPALREIGEQFPGVKFRICIDSAPVHERYWALKAGIGYRGDNGCVIVPGYGSMVFLAEIITDLEIEPDAPLNMDCGHCGACRKGCPGKALGDTIDCRRCLSYLTIEHRGDWDDTGAAVIEAQGKKITILGCDICQRVCPHNISAPATRIEAFRSIRQIQELSAEELRRMGAKEEGEEEFMKKFAGTSLVRPGLKGLIRNISQ